MSGVAVRSSEERRGSLRLRRFQLEVERAALDGGLVTVDAPTGSGKTLAALLAAWRAGPGEGRFAIFVYPTNQLVEDQARSLSSLVTRAGLSSDGGVVRTVTSESLDREARVRGLKSHGLTLLSILQEMKGGILLTNPEMLLVLLKGVPRMARHEAVFKEIFSSLGAIVVDEVHLYYGFSLANLTHSLHLLRRKVDLVLAMSATPSGLREIGEVFTAAGIRWVHVRAERRDWWGEEGELHEDGLWDPVRMPGELEVIPGSGRVLWGEEDLGEMAKLCVRAYEALKDRPLPEGAVRLLVLVNSVVFAESLARRLEDALGVEVSRVHGLVPPGQRGTGGEVVVGTRAADVGVDFHALGVVFEASDAPTFIQRLGRGCRRESGPAWAVIS
ncbi:MAG: type I-D CRISPR-associated helicase Cas3', partial [Candidatus Korarchaeota archaeon]|nr:type I-D CRISPR-associated helicase Cas3' [Candidatus Korarchaeota archaeon]